MPSALPLPREQKTANISLDFTSSSKRNFNSNSMICSGSGSAWLLPTPHKQQTKTIKNSALTTLNNNNNINNEFISNSFYNGSNSSWLFPSTTTNRKMSRLPSINNSEFILIRTQPNQIKINKDSTTSLVNSSKKISN